MLSAASGWGHNDRVLRNLILGVVATAIWMTNWLVYFAYDIQRAWHRRAYRRMMAETRDGAVSGPLAPRERRPFPPPPPPDPPVRDAEVIPPAAPGQPPRKGRRP